MKYQRSIPVRILFVCTFLSAACMKTDSDPESLSRLPSCNKTEILKVLDYYSAPEDSLKYQAAAYLIGSMTNAAYYQSEKFEQFSTIFDSLSKSDPMLLISTNRLKNKEIRRRTFDELWNFYRLKYGHPNEYVFEKYYDLENITADLLIENIEFAFKAWELPWSRSYSFEDFCRYILPYRENTEPLVSWRPYYYENVRWVIDSMTHESDPVRVAVVINEWLARDYWGSENLKGLRRGALKPTDLLKGRIAGDCFDQTVLGCSIMRSMGIATAQVIIPHWGRRGDGHAFNAVLNKSGQWIDFHAGDQSPGSNFLSEHPPKAFIKRVQSRQTENDSANYLNHLADYIDITRQFNKVKTIVVRLKAPASSKYAYLCTFDNEKWVPVYYGKVLQDSIVFKDMGVDMVYLPAIVHQNNVTPIAHPIRIDSAGHVSDLVPLSETAYAHTFDRKYPVKEEVKAKRCQDLAGGKFQVADDRNFAHATDVFTISKFASYHPQIIPVKSQQKRYARFVFPKVKNTISDGPSMIRFYTTQGDEVMALEGKHISSKGVSDLNIKSVFDDDLLTYTCYTQYEPSLDISMEEIIVHKGNTDSLWVGIDFGRKASITSVGFCARNDKNEIYSGNLYELLYWDEKWISIARKFATGTSITFDGIPKQALLLLRCLNEGKEERIFVIDEGKLVWY